MTEPDHNEVLHALERVLERIRIAELAVRHMFEHGAARSDLGLLGTNLKETWVEGLEVVYRAVRSTPGHDDETTHIH